jgi:hypothetical protein
VSDGVEIDVPPDMQLWSGLRAFFRYVGEYRASWTVLHRQALTVGVQLDDVARGYRGPRTRPQPDAGGFEPGEDYKLAHYDQLVDYYHALAEASPRVELKDKTTQ